AKNILNLKIDKRLGLLHKTWEVPALLTFGKRDSKFPNLFGHQNARFLQPGPPPYFQQPEGANEAGIATLAPKPVAVAAPKIITSVTAPAPSAGGGPPPIPGGLP